MTGCASAPARAGFNSARLGRQFPQAGTPFLPRTRNSAPGFRLWTAAHRMCNDTWVMDADADLSFSCRATTPGPGPAGFAVGGAADSMPPGVTLAGLASGAWGAGLERLTDDQLIGLLRAWRRLTSWTAAGELAAAGRTPSPSRRRGRSGRGPAPGRARGP